jgi:toxin FitB
MYLIDTNVISELRKGKRCDPRVAAWFEKVSDQDLYFSVLMVGEIRQGVEKLRKSDARHAHALEKWLNEVIETFGSRILPIDQKVAEIWGRLTAQGPVPVVDTLLAATAEAHGLTLVTRNVKDIRGGFTRYLNPFDYEV